MTDYNDQAPDFGDDIDPDDVYDWDNEEDPEWSITTAGPFEDDSDVFEVVSVKLSAGDDTGAALTLCLSDGDMVTITPNDERLGAKFSAIAAAAAVGDMTEVTRLYNGGLTRGEQAVQTVVEERFARLSPRVTIEGRDVHFDGRPVHSIVASTILRYVQEGRDANGLVRFMERISSNPSKHAYDQAWSWIERQGLIVDEDGLVHGYKAIASDGLSSTSGREAVRVHRADGTVEEVVGRVPNPVGATIEMDRRNVDDDSSKDCSYGLHVGTYAYASMFAPVLTEVKFDPADIVSVPRYDTNKVRVCRYTVLDVHMPEVGDDLSKYEAESAGEVALATDDEEFEEALDGLVDEGTVSAEKVGLFKRVWAAARNK